MKTYRVFVLLEGAVGRMETPTTPPTMEAESLKEVFEELANSALPDNQFVRTVGVRIEEVEP